MIKRYFRRLFLKNKDFLLRESDAIKGFMQVLMKHRNTGEKWTKEEKKQIRQHLKTMALTVPALIVFMLPGGSIYLPVLVDVLDRRKEVRPLQESKPEKIDKKDETQAPLPPPIL